MSHLPPLHVTGPSHSPQVNIPQRATIPSPLATVAISPCTGESRLERNCSSVSNRDHWQLPKDIFDWQNIKNWVLGVELENDPTDPSQFRGKLCVVDDKNIYNNYNNYNNHLTLWLHMVQELTLMHNQKTLIQCQ